MLLMILLAKDEEATVYLSRMKVKGREGQMGSAVRESEAASLLAHAYRRRVVFLFAARLLSE